MYVTIFIDMLARCVNPDVFPQGALVSPLGVELTIKLPCRLQIVLVCVHAPRGLFRLSFFAPPSSPQCRKPASASLLRLRGNYFRPHLSIPCKCYNPPLISSLPPSLPSLLPSVIGPSTCEQKKYIR